MKQKGFEDLISIINSFFPNIIFDIDMIYKKKKETGQPVGKNYIYIILQQLRMNSPESVKIIHKEGELFKYQKYQLLKQFTADDVRKWRKAIKSNPEVDVTNMFNQIMTTLYDLNNKINDLIKKNKIAPEKIKVKETPKTGKKLTPFPPFSKPEIPKEIPRKTPAKAVNREQIVETLKLIKEHSYSEIGEKLGITKNQINRILMEIKRDLRNASRNDPIKLEKVDAYIKEFLSRPEDTRPGSTAPRNGKVKFAINNISTNILSVLDPDNNKPKEVKPKKYIKKDNFNTALNDIFSGI